MKFKKLGRDGGKHKIELETGEVLMVSDSELEVIANLEDDGAELIALPQPGHTVLNPATGEPITNHSTASHAIILPKAESDPNAAAAYEAAVSNEVHPLDVPAVLAEAQSKKRVKPAEEPVSSDVQPKEVTQDDSAT